MILYSRSFRFCFSVIALICASLFTACKSNIIIDPEDVYEDIPVWSRIDGIYGDRDTNVLASVEMPDFTIMFATPNGVWYLNTLTNMVDKHQNLAIGLPWPLTAIMNEFATVYIRQEHLVAYRTQDLNVPPLRLQAAARLKYTIATMQGSRLYYQYDVEPISENEGVWKLRYVDFSDANLDSQSAIKEIQIPLDSFVNVQGSINNLWTFDDQLFASYNNYFYRIERDGSYKRLSFKGVNIYPNKMFQLGNTLFALSNDYRNFTSNLLFFSNDQGDTWEPYPNNDDYLSYDYLRGGDVLHLDNKMYLSGGFGALTRWNYDGQKLLVDRLSFKDRLLLSIQSLYSVNDRYVYATAPHGIWRINKSVFTNQ